MPHLLPNVVCLRELEFDYEALLKLAWNRFLESFSALLLDNLNCIASFFGVIDALLSLSKLGKVPGFIQPRYDDTSDTIKILDCRHPLIEAYVSTNISSSMYIPNNVLIRCKFGENRAQLLSGPNMGGKSSYGKMVAISCLLGQMGAHIAAFSADMCPLDQIFTVVPCNGYRNEEVLCPGLSSFALELFRLEEVLKRSTSESLIVVDEIGRGTSASEGTAVARATFTYICRQVGCALVFISHFPEFMHTRENLITKGDNSVVNMQVDYILHDTAQLGTTISNMRALSKYGEVCSPPEDDFKNLITYLYKVVPGVAPESYALCVARLAGFDELLLQHAASVLSTLEAAQKK